MKLSSIFVFILPLALSFGCASQKPAALPDLLYSTWSAKLEADLQYAKMLQVGNTNALAQALDQAIEGSALFYGDPETHWPKDYEDWRLKQLWAIEHYYAKTGKPIPSDLAKIFASFPPAPPLDCVIEKPKSQKP